ncbi:hypothetical protein, partial [Stenotrophomonas sp.]|uniref:hypothetical protein n=1 Tax=Stenotrophomonas sp. TaxID=69392 RepID=UPI0028A5F34D
MDVAIVDEIQISVLDSQLVVDEKPPLIHKNGLQKMFRRFGEREAAHLGMDYHPCLSAGWSSAPMRCPACRSVSMNGDGAMQLTATERARPSRSWRAVAHLLAIAWVLVPLVTYAQIVPTWREEYDKRLKYGDLVEPLKGEIFGEKVNLYDGTLSFSATDITVPGNSAIAVSISRSYSDLSGSSIQNEFGNWTLDIPSLSGTYGDLEETAQGGYWTPCARCSTVSATSPPGLSSTTVWSPILNDKEIGR